MKRPNIVKDISLNRIYGKDYQNSKSLSSLQVSVSLITEVHFIALEVFKKLGVTLFCQLILLRDCQKVKTPGKFLASAYQIHNLTLDASKMVTTRFFFSVDSMITPLKLFTSTSTLTQKPRVKFLTFKTQIVFKNLISSHATEFT